MKLYSEYPHASISMSGDPELKGLITSWFENDAPSYVVETGTYQGLGSTTFLAQNFPPVKAPIAFHTIEVSPVFSKNARKNLARFPFVQVHEGLSVNQQSAIDFVQNDVAILQHQNYPEIFIDDVQAPQAFYLRELQGQLQATKARRGPIQDDLLHTLLNPIREQAPLIVLDSAGGIGFLEFQTVLELMNGQEFSLLLDDIHHLKHFRSWERVQQDARFTVQGHHSAHGWALARFKP